MLYRIRLRALYKAQSGNRHALMGKEKHFIFIFKINMVHSLFEIQEDNKFPTRAYISALKRAGSEVMLKCLLHLFPLLSVQWV